MCVSIPKSGPNLAQANNWDQFSTKSWSKPNLILSYNTSEEKLSLHITINKAILKR